MVNDKPLNVNNFVFTKIPEKNYLMVSSCSNDSTTAGTLGFAILMTRIHSCI